MSSAFSYWWRKMIMRRLQFIKMNSRNQSISIRRSSIIFKVIYLTIPHLPNTLRKDLQTCCNRLSLSMYLENHLRFHRDLTWISLDLLTPRDQWPQIFRTPNSALKSSDHNSSLDMNKLLIPALMSLLIMINRREQKWEVPLLWLRI
jgi:hypothetical protein